MEAGHEIFFVYFVFFFLRKPTRSCRVYCQKSCPSRQFLPCFSLPFSGTILSSQPTGWGHTLTRSPLPGWRVALPPRPPKSHRKPQAKYSNRSPAFAGLRTYHFLRKLCARRGKEKSRITIYQAIVCLKVLDKLNKQNI